MYLQGNLVCKYCGVPRNQHDKCWRCEINVHDRGTIHRCHNQACPKLHTLKGRFNQGLCLECEEEMYIVKINTPYYSAGQKYGWGDKEPGVGIASEYFAGNGPMFIKIGKEDLLYTIDKARAMELLKQYKSVEEHRGRKIGVLPIKELAVWGAYLEAEPKQ